MHGTHEVWPELGARIRLISVVICRNGYQAMIEETIDINFHPYTATIVRAARASTVCQAVKAAVTGKQLRQRHVG